MEMRPSAEFNGVLFRLEGVLFAIEAIRIREVLGGVDLSPSTSAANPRVFSNPGEGPFQWST